MQSDWLISSRDSISIIDNYDYSVLIIVIRAGTINRLIDYNQSILKILLIIDYKSVISIMLIIPEDILFMHVTASNGNDRKPF